MAAADIELLDGVPEACIKCGASLCLRKQVINLALGNEEDMRCLKCLAKECSAQPEKILANARGYIQARDCFRKEWKRYRSVDDCPDPKGCIPATCFCGE